MSAVCTRGGPYPYWNSPMTQSTQFVFLSILTARIYSKFPILRRANNPRIRVDRQYRQCQRSRNFNLKCDFAPIPEQNTAPVFTCQLPGRPDCECPGSGLALASFCRSTTDNTTAPSAMGNLQHHGIHPVRSPGCRGNTGIQVGASPAVQQPDTYPDLQQGTKNGVELTPTPLFKICVSRLPV